MAAITPWLTTGNGPFAVTLTPQTVAADGTLSDGTLVTLTGTVDDIEFNNDPTNENIKPMSTLRANYVNTSDDPSWTLVEILKSNGVNLLPAANYASDVFKLVVTRGAQVATYYGRRGPYGERIQNGKSTARLTLQPVDIGSANPAIV